MHYRRRSPPSLPSATAQLASTVEFRIPVTRAQFESRIADDLAAIEHSVDALLRSAGLESREVDRVFLTGGTSFVPAVRRT